MLYAKQPQLILFHLSDKNNLGNIMVRHIQKSPLIHRGCFKTPVDA